MPYVNIRVAGSLTKEQRAEMSQRVSTAISEVTGKPEANILIMIDELAHDYVAKNGKLLEPPK